jgi:hypothetical protein
MPEIPLEFFQLFWFTVPGFMLVWSYTSLSGRPKPSGFEYFALSIFWGLVLFVGVQFALGVQKFQQTLTNPLAMSLVLSVTGALVGGAVSIGNWTGDALYDNTPRILKWIRARKQFRSGRSPSEHGL